MITVYRGCTGRQQADFPPPDIPYVGKRTRPYHINRSKFELVWPTLREDKKFKLLCTVKLAVIYITQVTLIITYAGSIVILLV